MIIETFEGDILNADTDTIVNPWNRNYFGRWYPASGVAGALKKASGPQPWIELAQHGVMKVGEAHVTTAENLTQFKGIIHVAGLNSFWRATPKTITASVISAVNSTIEHEWNSVAFPLIGAGTGGLTPNQSHDLIQAAHQRTHLRCVVVLYTPPATT